MRRKAIGLAVLLLALIDMGAGVVSANYYSQLHWYDLAWRPSAVGTSFVSRLVFNPFFLLGVFALAIGISLLVLPTRVGQAETLTAAEQRAR
jgi:hypothetical protein